MDNLQVAIIGAGTAGPALALFLARQGHSVTIFERAAKIEPVGAGVLIQPTGQAVLRELGLLDSLCAHSAPVRRLHGLNSRRRRVLDLRYGDLRPGLSGLGVHRALLLHLLLEALEKEPRARMVCGHEIESYRRLEDKRWELTETDGDRHGPFDLLVFSDGARSKLRAELGLERKAEPYPWGALWAIVPDRERLYPDVLFQVYESTKLFLGFLPTGRCLTTGEPLVSVFWSLRNDSFEGLRERGWPKLRDEMLRLEAGAAPIIDEIHGFDQLLHARYVDVVMRPWHKDGAVCIGDSAHAMSPQLGQGANLALRDAAELARCLAHSGSVDEALHRYTRQRAPQLDFYQFATRSATWFFQSDWPSLALVRDSLFGVLNDLPIYKGQMLRTLVGVKRGILRPSEAIDGLPRVGAVSAPATAPQNQA